MRSLIDHHRQTNSLNYHCLIPVDLYGPHDDFDQKTCHAIASIIRRFNGGVLTYKGSCEPLRQFLYAPDLVRIIKTVVNELILYDRLRFNDMVCSGPEVSMGDMSRAIATVVGEDPDKVIFQPEYADGCMTKTVSDYMFKTTYPNLHASLLSLEDGLSKTYEWYCDHWQPVTDIQI
jgi:GDP-L-fucose synthase